MQILTLLYIAPVVLFLVVAGMWYVGRGLPRLISALPIAACYAATAALLFMGGCQPVAHVALEGFEADLVDRDGQLRQISIGSGDQIRSLAGIQVRGYPQDALRVQLDRETQRLRLVPGTGYQRGLLVRTDEGLLPLEGSGLPRLVPLENGDQFRLTPNAGGEALVRWQLGEGKFDLTPGKSRVRWVGGEGSGLAKLDHAPGRLFGLEAEGTRLEVWRGPDLPDTQGVAINGVRLVFNAEGRAVGSYQPGLTQLALVSTDVAAGGVLFRESGPFAFGAEMLWKSMHEDAPSLRSAVEAGWTYRIGGALGDDLFVRGLPPAALELEVDASGTQVELRLSQTGAEAFERGEFEGVYPQQVPVGSGELVIGGVNDPAGGRLILSAVPRATPVEEESVTLAEVSDEASDGPAEEGEGLDESTDVTVEEETGPVVPPLLCTWLPNVETRLELPNREITLPLLNHEIPLGQRRPWAQRVFPLAAVTPRSSSLRSCVVYGQKHERWINGANLLLLEPGIQVMREGAAVAAPAAVAPGILPEGGRLDFLQVAASAQGGRFGAVTADAWHPTSVWEAERVVLQKRFAAFELTQRSGGGDRTLPVLRARLSRPEIQSLPLADVEEALEELNEDSVDVRFGLNDRSGFSQLPHQVRFRELSSWFNSANADVTLNWLSFTSQDDFRSQQLKYDEPFLVGGDRRLMLRVTKHDRPWTRIASVVGAGLTAFVITILAGSRLGWIALMFGAAFITCSRVLFGQAALVNPPYNDEVIRIAMVALWVVPLFLGAWAALTRQLLPGRIERLLARLEKWITYRRLVWLSLAGLLCRVALLGAGFKEAIPLGPVRFALSIGFVPFYLLLFALAFFILWRNKQEKGWFDWAQLRPFLVCALFLSAFQGMAALLVSDLGMMLYFIPQALVMAGVGVAAGVEGGLRWLRAEQRQDGDRPWQIAAGAVVPVLPLAFIAVVFLTPQAFLAVVPGLSHKLSDTEDLITDSTLLRVLQFADKDYLMGLGTDTAERIAQDHAIMENYAHRGLVGEGYLGVHVVPAKYVTALNDNVSSVFVLAQFGVVGGLAVLIAYLAIPAAATGVGPRPTFTAWLALTAGLSFGLVSVFMIGANYGFLPFTGRNMYLLGLNSWSDLAESLLLLGCIVLHGSRSEFHDEAISTENAAQLDLGDLVRGSPKPSNG